MLPLSFRQTNKNVEVDASSINWDNSEISGCYPCQDWVFYNSVQLRKRFISSPFCDCVKMQISSLNENIFRLFDRQIFSLWQITLRSQSVLNFSIFFCQLNNSLHPTVYISPLALIANISRCFPTCSKISHKVRIVQWAPALPPLCVIYFLLVTVIDQIYSIRSEIFVFSFCRRKPGGWRATAENSAKIIEQREVTKTLRCCAR